MSSEGFAYDWNPKEKCDNCQGLCDVNVGRQGIDVTFAYLDTSDDYIDSTVCKLLYE